MLSANIKRFSYNKIKSITTFGLTQEQAIVDYAVCKCLSTCVLHHDKYDPTKPTDAENIGKRTSPHFRKQIKPNAEQKVEGSWNLPHPIWGPEELKNVPITHKRPGGISDTLAYWTVRIMRFNYDAMSGFKWGQRNEKKWINRICFLETVAGVPGMMAGMLRHMRSLRRMERDWGWIHTLLEEAENERMHLMTILQLKKPGWLFRAGVLLTQGFFASGFFIFYIISPKFCHRFVGYLEEEAVKTYTMCLKDIDEGPMKHWQTEPAPQIAINYWKLADDATMRDVILVIRADEDHHRLVNHNFADMKADEKNPFKPGQ